MAGIGAMVIMAFLLGRVDLFGSVWPFAPAYVAALKPRRAAGAMILGTAAVLGGLSVGQLPAGIAQGTAVGLYFWLLLRWPGEEWITEAKRMSLAIVPTVGVLILASNPGITGVALTLLQITLTTLLSIYLRPLLSLRSRFGEILNGHEQDRFFSLGLLGAALVVGLGGLKLGMLELAAVAGGLLAAMAGWWGGAGTGSLVGIMIGAGQLPAAAASLALAWSLALGGALAGLFRERGKWAAAAGCGLGGFIGWLGAGETPWVLLSLVSGAFLLPLTPSDTLERLPGERPAAARRDGAKDGRLSDLARLFREVSGSYREIATTEEAEPSPEQEMASLVGRLVHEICDGCRGYRICWQDDFGVNFQKARDLFLQAKQGGLREVQVKEAWNGRCPNPREMALFINYLTELRTIERRWLRRLNDSRDLMAGHFHSLAHIIEDLARGSGRVAARASKRRTASGARRLKYVTEVAKLARPGWMISGDSHLVKELPSNMLLLALSDGMGCGFPAATESRVAVDLAEKLLRSGFDKKTVIRMANSLMGLRSPGETYATLDLTLVDLDTGHAEVVKVGASPTFLMRDGNVKVIRAQSLPLGILDSTDPHTTRFKVRSDDTIVMVTDGILEGDHNPAAREAWVKNVMLSHEGADRGGGLARALLEEVSENLSKDRADDMTVLAVRFLAGG